MATYTDLYNLFSSTLINRISVIPLTWKQEEMTTLRSGERIVKHKTKANSKMTPDEILDNWKFYTPSGKLERFNGKPGQLTLSAMIQPDVRFRYTVAERWRYDYVRLDVIFLARPRYMSFVEDWFRNKEQRLSFLHQGDNCIASFAGYLKHCVIESIASGDSVLRLVIVSHE